MRCGTNSGHQENKDHRHDVLVPHALGHDRQLIVKFQLPVLQAGHQQGHHERSSVGTITLITPIAAAVSNVSGFSLALCVGSVMGGAMYPGADGLDQDHGQRHNGGGQGDLEVGPEFVPHLTALGVAGGNGGVFIRRVFKGRVGGRLGVGLLVGAMDIATANNTVAIVMAGPIAKEISEEYNISPKESASLLDTFSCVFQGVIPYGAQMLVAIPDQRAHGRHQHSDHDRFKHAGSPGAHAPQQRHKVHRPGGQHDGRSRLPCPPPL